MVNRINLILQAKNITARQFAEEIGIQPSGMSHILGGRNNPSLDFVQKVIRRYPEIDANWLLMGRGEMYAAGMPSDAAQAKGFGTEPEVEGTGMPPVAPVAELSLFSDVEPVPAVEAPAPPAAQQQASGEADAVGTASDPVAEPEAVQGEVVPVPQADAGVADAPNADAGRRMPVPENKARGQESRVLVQVLFVYSDRTVEVYRNIVS